MELRGTGDWLWDKPQLRIRSYVLSSFTKGREYVDQISNDQILTKNCGVDSNEGESLE
jgi:hypothetical protein